MSKPDPEHPEQLVWETFVQRHDHEPQGVWAGPGRVNLIGEHTDYNDGYVLPFALTQRALVAVGRRDDDVLNVFSAQMSAADHTSLDELIPVPHREDQHATWADYVWGVVWALRQDHQLGGLDVVLSSDVPVGAGLSSSAAIECATMAALCDLFELDIEPMDRVRLARQAENEYVGAPTGILDQAASTLCVEGAALLLDCRDLSTRHIELRLSSEDLELLVLDTKTAHSHVDGEYAERRRTCEQAAQMLGIAALRDITDLDAATDQLVALGATETMVKRVHHVVSENLRVLAAAASADAQRLVDLGELLNASHVSMRDDFEITVPAVDLAVETARHAGALGARMTGGGFGGCIIALHSKGEGDAIGEAVAAAFSDAGYPPPQWFVAHPSGGAHRLEVPEERDSPEQVETQQQSESTDSAD